MRRAANTLLPDCLNLKPTVATLKDIGFHRGSVLYLTRPHGDSVCDRVYLSMYTADVSIYEHTQQQEELS